MSLLLIEYCQVRNLVQSGLNFSPGLNLIVGANASGKTSLLEAIYLLGHGRSFRSAKIQHVIQQSQPLLWVFGRVTTQDQGSVALGVEKGKENTRIKVAGQFVRNSSQLAQHLPLQLITPDSHRLVEQGPKYRRQFLDWGVFHVEHRFHPLWQRFHRALKQRNALLRQKRANGDILIWDKELVQYAEEMDAMRRAYLELLLPIARHNIHQLLDLEQVSLDYSTGWRQGQDYRDSLMQNIDGDREVGYTRYGPHRAEITIKIDGQVANQRVSRGQQKLLAAALQLAQVELLKQRRNIRPVVLIDDLPAELDEYRRQRFLQLLQGLDTQVFITATEEKLLGDLSLWGERKVFHVEQGNIHEMANDGIMSS